jgi:hypothetical protein
VVVACFNVIFQLLYGEENESHKWSQSGSPIIQRKPDPGTNRVQMRSFILHHFKIKNSHNDTGGT